MSAFNALDTLQVLFIFCFIRLNIRLQIEFRVRVICAHELFFVVN